MRPANQTAEWGHPSDNLGGILATADWLSRNAIVSSLLTNRGTADLTVDLGEPSLPRISFTVQGKNVNALAGYVNEMDITAMRDTITPLEENGTLQMAVPLQPCRPGKDGGTAPPGVAEYVNNGGKPHLIDEKKALPTYKTSIF